MKTDHWFYGLFQSAPDLITLLLPVVGASAAPPAPSLAANAPGDALYRFEAPELGTPQQPVVLLEVQMQAKAGFKHRLFAQTARFLQLHPLVQHLAVVVVVPHRRLRLGPDRLPRQLESFLAGVHWLNLEELGQQPGLDPLLSLLTLPVRPKSAIPEATEQILGPRPELLEIVVSILGEWFPQLTREEIMALINIPTDHLRHTRFAQDWIEEGRQEGEARGRLKGEAVVTLRQLNRRCGPLSEATTARIQALPLAQLESLADALLDFTGHTDLAAWLAQHGG